jgi:hypothetical protein
METTKHAAAEQLEQGFDDILKSPKDGGVVEMIVRRPAVDEREVLREGELSLEEGLAGDNWCTRFGSEPLAPQHRDVQITIMNARVIALVAGAEDRWPLAGDQLYVDLDLGKENLPPGSRLRLGTAVLEVTEVPHLGCRKFAARYGMDAVKFVNSRRGKQLNFRGINAKVVKAGVVRVKDRVDKLPADAGDVYSF